MSLYTNCATDAYDYVVCGGGTSGCVVAARLAEDPDVTVAVIEAGPDSKDLENVHMPGGWSQNFEKETDWNIITPPQKTLNNRKLKLSRGRFVGGSSGVNGTVCIRGTKQDYDDWGLAGWSGDDMFKYMAKAETFYPTSWFNPDRKEHGFSGPLHIGPQQNAPISDLFMESFIDQGVPFVEDLFTTGEVPQGCGHVPRTIHQGIRSTAANFVTKREKQYDNLTILTGSTVDKVLFEHEDGTLRATRVQVVDKTGAKIITAKREVIVSGGSYCTPAILLRSGIGAKEEPEKLGFECKINLPGVGKNLMDHVIVFFFYETSKPGLTYDSQLYHSNALASAIAQYKAHKIGPLSVFPFGTFAWARLDTQLADSPLWTNAPRAVNRDPMGLAPCQPHIEMWNSECYGGPLDFVDLPVDGEHVFATVALLWNAKSRGTVTIDSADPMGVPVVDPNFLSDEGGLDMLVLSEGCRYANAIVMNGKGTKGIVKGSWPRGRDHHTWTSSREQWTEYVRENAMQCYHPAGTCKMGKADDVMAVCDERLRVRGVKGLRVVDVSVMPIVNNGHTQMPAYAIGEKAADMIKEDWKRA